MFAKWRQRRKEERERKERARLGQMYHAGYSEAAGWCLRGDRHIAVVMSDRSRPTDGFEAWLDDRHFHRYRGMRDALRDFDALLAKLPGPCCERARGTDGQEHEWNCWRRKR